MCTQLSQIYTSGNSVRFRSKAVRSCAMMMLADGTCVTACSVARPVYMHALHLHTSASAHHDVKLRVLSFLSLLSVQKSRAQIVGHMLSWLMWLDFPQSFQASGRHRPRLSPSRYFPIHYSLIILPFDAIYGI
jgi:hypothetical protein